MNVSPLVLFLLVGLVAPRPSTAESILPNPAGSVASGPSSPVHLLITPAGNGPSLSSLGAQISVLLVDANLDPIAGMSFSDFFVNSYEFGDLAICRGGVADANTDALGETVISGSLAGGGATQSGLNVYLYGADDPNYPFGSPPLSFTVNSPDRDGDRDVDLVDVGFFAADLASGESPFRSDFDASGNVDIADVGTFVAHLGEVCP